MVPLETESVRLGAPLRAAVAVIERTRNTIAVVLDGDGRVAGSVSDGDVRRALLRGLTLDAPVQEAMNAAPLTADVNSADAFLLDLLQERGVEAVPLVDAYGRFRRVAHVSAVAQAAGAAGAAETVGFRTAVIMAGGEGRRLRPLTDTLPKPMVEVGGMPLLERLVRTLARGGIDRIWLSVNYLGHVIEDHFGDGNDFGVRIDYLREKQKLGTAGALSLLPTRPDSPMLVMNGDVFLRSDYRHLWTFHREHQPLATVAAVHYHVTIPYGVLRTKGTRVTALEEKPSQRFLCNAGIYALSPQAMALIPPDTFFDMPDLIARAMEAEGGVSVFPIHEYWTDIGTLADLHKARRVIETLEKKP